MTWMDTDRFVFGRFAGAVPGTISTTSSEPPELAPNDETLAIVSRLSHNMLWLYVVVCSPSAVEVQDLPQDWYPGEGKSSILDVPLPTGEGLVQPGGDAPTALAQTSASE
jgi:hypothetical protein